MEKKESPVGIWIKNAIRGLPTDEDLRKAYFWESRRVGEQARATLVRCVTTDVFELVQFLIISLQSLVICYRPNRNAQLGCRSYGRQCGIPMCN
jgi:hypothetical protein